MLLPCLLLFPYFSTATTTWILNHATWLLCLTPQMLSAPQAIAYNLTAAYPQSPAPKQTASEETLCCQDRFIPSPGGTVTETVCYKQLEGRLTSLNSNSLRCCLRRSIFFTATCFPCCVVAMQTTPVDPSPIFIKPYKCRRGSPCVTTICKAARNCVTRTKTNTAQNSLHSTPYTVQPTQHTLHTMPTG